MFCGAIPGGERDDGGFGDRQCIERDDHQTASGAMPEPKLREAACEDAQIIGDRMREIEAERLEAVNKPE